MTIISNMLEWRQTIRDGYWLYLTHPRLRQIIIGIRGVKLNASWLYSRSLMYKI